MTQELGDHIAEAQAAGQSDDAIVQKFVSMYPNQKSNIDEAMKAGQTSSNIVQKLKTSKYNDFASPAPNQDTSAKVIDTAKATAAPFQKGVSDYASGAAQTLNTLGLGGGASKSLADAGNVVAPQNYTPSAFDWHHPIDTAGEIPKAIAESLPALGIHNTAGMVGAGIGGAVAGPPGAIAGGFIGRTGSYGLENYGRALQTVAEANHHDVPTSGDKLRALGDIIVNGAMLSAGLPGTAGTLAKAGENTVAHVAGETAKNVGKMGVMGAGQSVTDQALLTGKVDPNQVINNAVIGGATGGAIRLANTPKDFNVGSKNAQITPEQGASLAGVLREHNGDQAPTTPEEAYQHVTNTKEKLAAAADALGSDTNVKNHIDSLQDADQSDRTKITLGEVKSAIKSGGAADPEHIQQLRDAIGSTPKGAEYVDTLENQSTLNKLINQGVLNEKEGTFSGGTSASPKVQDWLNPVGEHGKYLGIAPIVGAAMGVHLPGPLGATVMHSTGPFTGLAGQIAASKALKLIDKYTGSATPLENFLERNPSSAPKDYSSLGPEFNDHLNEAKAQEQAKQQADKAAAKEADTQAKQDAKTKEEQDKLLATVALRKLASSRATSPATVPEHGQPLPEPDTSGSSPVDTLRQKTARLGQEFATQQARSQGQTVRNGQVVANDATKAIAAARLKQALERSEAAPPEAEVPTPSEPTSSSTKHVLDLARLNQRVEKFKSDSAKQSSEAAPETTKESPKAEPTSSSTKDSLELAKTNARVAKLKQSYAKAEAKSKTGGRTEKAPKSSTAKSEASSKGSAKGQEYNESGNNITVNHRGYSVTRTSQGVQKNARYAAAIRQRMDTRHNAIDKVRAMTTSKSAKSALHTLQLQLNNNAHSWHQAEGFIDKAANGPHMPEALRAHIQQHLKTEEVKATWNE